LSFLISISCSETEQIAPDLGLDYYPMRVGNYAIYEVMEKSVVQSITTENSYALKVTYSDSIRNDNGEVTYIILREKKNSGSTTWQALDTWSVKRINNQILQNESNVVYVKLILPPSLHLKWDGNQYNNRGELELFYDGNDIPYFISDWDRPITLSTGLTAENTFTVVQNDYNDETIGINEQKEIYAKGIGLIYKEINQVIKCTGTLCFGDRSYLFIQNLKEYGRI